jgi:hypothetical protein
VLVVEPESKTPRFDVQMWTYLGWKGTAIPLGRRLGEWAWVGRGEAGPRLY